MDGNMEITEQLLTGAAIAGTLDNLATLRLGIFPEYPYLYQGRREDELSYLATYAEVPDACAILAYDGLTVIGAATGMPLVHEDTQILDAFAGTKFPLYGIYYVGELLFRPAYRNCGLGQKLLVRLEHYIRSLGSYSKLTCASVVRPDFISTGQLINHYKRRNSHERHRNQRQSTEAMEYGHTCDQGTGRSRSTGSCNGTVSSLRSGL